MTLECLIQKLVVVERKNKRETGRHELYKVNFQERGKPEIEKFIQSIEGVVNCCKKHQPDNIYLSLPNEEYAEFWRLYNSRVEEETQY